MEQQLQQQGEAHPLQSYLQKLVDGAPLQKVQVEKIEADARSLVISNKAEADEADRRLNEWKGHRDSLALYFAPGVGFFHGLWKSATNARAMALDPVERGIATADTKIKTWLRRVRDEEQQRKTAAEAQAKREADEARKAAEALAMEGDIAGAAKLEQRAAMTEMIPAALPPAKPMLGGGSSVREPWTWEITDRRAVLQGILDGKIPWIIKTWDDKLIRSEVTAKRNALNWPGVRTFQDITTARGRR